MCSIYWALQSYQHLKIRLIKTYGERVCGIHMYYGVQWINHNVTAVSDYNFQKIFFVLISPFSLLKCKWFFSFFFRCVFVGSWMAWGQVLISARYRTSRKARAVNSTKRAPWLVDSWSRAPDQIQMYPDRDTIDSLKSSIVFGSVRWLREHIESFTWQQVPQETVSLDWWYFSTSKNIKRMKNHQNFGKYFYKREFDDGLIILLWRLTRVH